VEGQVGVERGLGRDPRGARSGAAGKGACLLGRTVHHRLCDVYIRNICSSRDFVFRFGLDCPIVSDKI
jgi:hypothetical protein